MLTAVKNQVHMTLLTTKYALIREMLNKTTFLMNIVFMILNNACFIVQWIILYSIKDGVGGYQFHQILLLWGIAASTFGFSRFFFCKAFRLSEIIYDGKLDSFLVQPKNVLLSVITSEVSTSAIGDLIYGYIMLGISGFSISNFFLFTLFTVSGGFLLVSISVILSSFSFWLQKSDMILEVGNSLLINFATYPEGVFQGTMKILFYTILPIGFINYLPLQILSEFHLGFTILILLISCFFVTLAFTIFHFGLKRYSSSNLMISKI